MAPARLALYVNGVLEFCMQGTVRLGDIPYREGTIRSAYPSGTEPPDRRRPGPTAPGSNW